MPQPGEVEKVLFPGEVELELVWIPGGTFQMGCSPGDSECDSDESPRHQVTVDGFWIGKYEVTQRQWKTVTMGSNPSKYKGDQQPVENVSWNDAREFLRRIDKVLRLPTEAELEIAALRLPTEVEWEFAARGGTKGPYYGKLEEIAWYVEGLESRHHQVGQKKPNDYGLYDMLGNVWEWTADRYGDYRTGSQRNPTGSSDSSKRVNRGGAWGSSGKRYRVSGRRGVKPDLRRSSLGFRLARSAL